MENNMGLSNKQKALSIYKWTMKKYLPFSIAYWILLFLSFPLIEIFGMIVCEGDGKLSAIEIYIDSMKTSPRYMMGTGFTLIVIGFSAILAIIAFSYMHNKRAVDFFGSFPVSRRTLFFARYLAVITACVVPVIIIGGIGAMLTLSDAGMIGSVKVIGLLLLEILGNVSFIAFISLCCGTVADVIISYGIINVVYPICIAICYTFPKSIIPGLSGGYMPGSVFTMFCPVAAPFVGIFGDGKTLHIVWWLILSVVLMAGCYILCRKRKAETAQNAFAFAAVEIVIKFITCFVAGFGAGWVLSYIGDAGSVKEQYVWFFVGLVIGIMVANILLHLIFHRGLSKYKQSLIECGAVFVTGLAFLVIVTTGAFGYDMRIPDAADIAEVSVKTGNNMTFTVKGQDILEKYSSDKKIINDAVDVHQQIAELIKKSKHQGFYALYHNEYGLGVNSAIGGNVYEAYLDARGIKFVYKMKNGSTIKRSFYVSRYQLNISNELKSITMEDAQVIGIIPAKYADTIDINKFDNDENQTSYSTQLYKNSNISTKNMEIILSALKKDIQEKGVSEEEDKEWKYYLGITYNNDSREEWVDCNINIPESYENTIRALEETGYANVAYYELKEYADEYTYERLKGQELETGRTIYFEVPDNWDKDTVIQCMPYHIDEEDEVEEEALTDIDDEATKCEKVSDKVWKYTIKIPKKEESDYYDGIRFYQITKTETRCTGIVKLSKKEEENLFRFSGSHDENMTFYLGRDYDYSWSVYENK